MTACKSGNEAAVTNDGQKKEKTESVVLASDTTVLELKKKYGSEKEKSIMPLYNVAQDHEFIFEFNSDVRGAAESVKDIVSVHTDSKALPESRIIDNTWPEQRDGKTILPIQPGFGVMHTKTMSERSGDVWGGAPIYYIRINYDLDATVPTKLDKPLIIPFTVKSDVPVPNLNYEISPSGMFKLTWDKVEGAESYRVYERRIPSLDEINHPLSGAEEGYVGLDPTLIAEIKETEFNDFMDDGEGGLGISRFDDGVELVSYMNGSVEGEYYVTAVAGDKESGFSKAVETLPISNRIPTEMAEDLLYENHPTVHDLPKTTPIKYLDGSVVDRKIIYHTEGVTPAENYETSIKLTIEGTAFISYFDVGKITTEELASLGKSSVEETNGYVPPQNTTDYVPAPTVPTIIEADAVPSDSGAIVADQKNNTQKKVDEGNAAGVPVPKVVSDVPVNADSALEEYLALNLIAGEEAISLKAFPDAQNFETLTDVFRKVLYQNALILGVKEFGYDYGTLTLYVGYEYEQDKIVDMQQEIVEEAGSLVTTIFKSDMTDEDKHLALYQYLNDNTKYDDAALESAEKNNFESVGPEFNDSFNVYGIMVKKVGVCASYAATYKMLSDLAGLESIVVTGNMSGVPHAWNKVKLSNGWVHVDATNNETNSGIPFLLYGSSDETAESLNFYLDKDYWVDSGLAEFEAADGTKDYYTVNDLEVDSSVEMTAKVANLLKAAPEEPVVVRMTTELSDTELGDSLAAAFSEASITDLSNVEVGSLGTYLFISP
ncbi:transglutaminase domain-containing protein [Paenibacillus sp. GCM10027627]